MQTAAFYQHPPQARSPSPRSPPGRRSSARTRLAPFATPCSTAAHTFVQIVPPLSRFQLALDVLMPMLDAPAELTQRILVSYILFSLYAPHPIAINPFKSVLYATFIKERDAAVRVAEAGGVHENEQFVWVLWKILKGDGKDIGPFSPNTLAKSPLPPKLRASNLALEEEAPLWSLENGLRNGSNGSSEAAVSAERDHENEAYSRAASLLLAARERVLSLSEYRITSPSFVTSSDLPSILAINPTLGHPLVITLLTMDSDVGSEPYLDVLRTLPPTLPSFDLVGKLLRDTMTINDHSTGGRTTIADVVRTEVLGWFINSCVSWLDRAEQDEREGNISDDRFTKGVQNLCRFFNSLIKLNILEEANTLYRVLAMHKF
ncbi:uncharacterized protein BXZ73DRAFT_92491 [Epithele typhae]|uniref:uncharacterized protein n=1 Tax=Epithele typhae TaxID=378194 RepID=UPI0020072463|nr:uncharacterized protein BXZ73DRAFT_92491 [Epithele typhae]KAH9916386.1 hypothetical protein BXZ73DRAFT_92491 [Epithele typhae]